MRGHVAVAQLALLLGLLPGKLTAALQLGVEEGVLDITQPPFSVDNSGRSDVTAALQAAVDFAHNRTLVAYFPAGDYLVSDTIKCFEMFYWHTEDNNTWPSRFTPHVLVRAAAYSRWGPGGPTLAPLGEPSWILVST